MKKIKRRDFLKYSGIGGVLLLTKTSPFGLVESTFSEDVKEVKLAAAINNVDLGNGRKFKAWTYNGQIPGPEIRVKEGEILRVVVKNNLPEETTIHWHGIPVPNNIEVALKLESVDADVQFHRINETEAKGLSLMGSPSVLINGADILPVTYLVSLEESSKTSPGGSHLFLQSVC